MNPGSIRIKLDTLDVLIYMTLNAITCCRADSFHCLLLCLVTAELEIHSRIRHVLTHNCNTKHSYQCNRVRTAAALMILNHACRLVFVLEISEVHVCTKCVYIFLSGDYYPVIKDIQCSLHAVFLFRVIFLSSYFKKLYQYKWLHVNADSRHLMFTFW